MTEDEGVAFLSRIGWLSPVAPDFRKALLCDILWRRFEAGETVGFVGDAAGGIFGIAAGQLGQTSGVGAVDSPVAHVSLPGNWEGTNPVLGRPRYADSTAMTASLIALVPLAKLRRHLADNPAWWEDIGHLVREHTVRFGSGMTDLLMRDSAQRCMAVLLRFGGCRFAGDAPVTIALTQDQLAASANMSRHLAGEALRRVEADGCLSLGYRQITILNAGALRAMVNAG